LPVPMWSSGLAQHPRLLRVHAKSDLAGRQELPGGSIAVSSLTGAGLKELLERLSVEARSFLPREDAIALNRRQASHISDAAQALEGAASAQEVILVAEELRRARLAFDRLTGRAGVEDLLDSLFGRFCLGK
jgi:tRNA modification GTPase